MGAVAIVVHPTHADARRLAQDAAAWLSGRGHRVCLLTTDPTSSSAVDGIEPCVGEGSPAVADLDLVLSLGGDGTMLRAVDTVAAAGVPVMGVNLGRLGYLTEVEPTALHAALGRWEAGEFEVEERMRMAVELVSVGADSPPSGTHSALNEAVLSKTPTGQMTHVLVTIDGERFTTYSADGLIVATATGSTAYAWSAGGPIVEPSHQALILTPVAPHMLFDRSLVLPPTACVRLDVVDDRPADLSVDGRSLGILSTGDAIVCTAAPQPARLVSFGPRSFLAILKGKFGLADR